MHVRVGKAFEICVRHRNIYTVSVSTKITSHKLKLPAEASSNEFREFGATYRELFFVILFFYLVFFAQSKAFTLPLLYINLIKMTLLEYRGELKKTLLNAF